MKYKKITNREAVELFLAGSDKLRVLPPGFITPVLLSKDIPAMEFADDSSCEFYTEYEPLKASFDTVLTNVLGNKTLRDFDIRIFQPLSIGSRVRVTIEEVVD